MSASKRIPFNRPFATGRELDYIARAHELGHLSGDGDFTRRCHDWLEREVGCSRALLTHSCTAALEMAALLLDLAPGDEIIMPSFTFVSTANAFVLRGAVPVFVDIGWETFNIDPVAVEAAITPRTRAIVPVHYAGVACDMDSLLALARDRDLRVIEDAAQALGSSYRGRPLGSMGELAALSFHETKNLISGEGGALLVNDPALAQRAEIIRNKGTDRARFLRGEVDKYTWVDLGSSFLPAEIVAAFLLAQLEDAAAIAARRKALWSRYHDGLEELERQGLLRRPIVPDACAHNAHLYYVLTSDPQARTRLIATLAGHGVQAVFHYVPLHSSPAGRRFGRAHGNLTATDEVSARLVRLPLWLGLEEHLDRIIAAVHEAVQWR